MAQSNFAAAAAALFPVGCVDLLTGKSGWTHAAAVSVWPLESWALNRPIMVIDSLGKKKSTTTKHFLQCVCVCVRVIWCDERSAALTLLDATDNMFLKWRDGRTQIKPNAALTSSRRTENWSGLRWDAVSSLSGGNKTAVCSLDQDLISFHHDGKSSTINPKLNQLRPLYNLINGGAGIRWNQFLSKVGYKTCRAKTLPNTHTHILQVNIRLSSRGGHWAGEIWQPTSSHSTIMYAYARQLL